MIDNTSALEFNNSVQDRLTEICQPLRDYLGIENCNYGRFYNNNRALCLPLTKSFAHYFFMEKAQVSNKYQNLLSSTKNLKNFCIWNDISDDPIMRYCYEIEQLKHGCTIFKRGRNFIESWNFLLKREKDIPLDFYLRNKALLEHFTIYFLDKIHDLLKSPDSKKLAHIRCDINFTGNIEDQKEKFLQATPIKKYYAESQGKELCLTPQEFECLKYYAQGMSMKEIARINKKGIAPRTVEAHLDKVKKKTGYTFKNELAKFFEANFGF